MAFEGTHPGGGYPLVALGPLLGELLRGEFGGEESIVHRTPKLEVGIVSVAPLYSGGAEDEEDDNGEYDEEENGVDNGFFLFHGTIIACVGGDAMRNFAIDENFKRKIVNRPVSFELPQA